MYKDLHSSPQNFKSANIIQNGSILLTAVSELIIVLNNIERNKGRNSSLNPKNSSLKWL